MDVDDAGFAEWIARSPNAVSRDPVWRLPAYRIAGYCAHLAWADVSGLAKHPVTAPVAVQLYRAVGSIGANLAEGYSRSSGRDRVRLYEYALGSARESAVWYALAAPVLGDSVSHERRVRLQEVVRMLLITIPRERHRNIALDG